MSTFIRWQHERYDYTLVEYIGEWYGCLFIACITAGDIYFHSSPQPLRHALQEPWKDGYFTLGFIGLHPWGFSDWSHTTCSWRGVHLLLLLLLVSFQRAALFPQAVGVWQFLKVKWNFYLKNNGFSFRINAPGSTCYSDPSRSLALHISGWDTSPSVVLSLY